MSFSLEHSSSTRLSIPEFYAQKSKPFQNKELCDPAKEFWVWYVNWVRRAEACQTITILYSEMVQNAFENKLKNKNRSRNDQKTSKNDHFI